MPLGEEFERSGAWLFQRRSYVPPLLLIGVAVAASERPGRDDIPGLEAPVALAGLAVALVKGLPTITTGASVAAIEPHSYTLDILIRGCPERLSPITPVQNG